MTIPSGISIARASLQAQVEAAQPLDSASSATITALQLNAGNLVAAIQTALTTTTTIPNVVVTTDSILLDSYVAPIDAATIVTGILTVLVSAQNQNQLSLMRGTIGRATSNLDQI